MRAGFLALAVVLVAACGDDGPAVVPADARPTDAGTDPDAATPPCFTNPHTHLEIINACTSAERIYKTSNPPLLLPDGGLPPLP
jgi:hypothetical protein